jgi:hypothetical protein
MNKDKRVNLFDNLSFFYYVIFTSSIIPYLPEIIPGVPKTIAGFNFNGWAWILTLCYSFIVIIFNGKNITYYALPFLGWILYIVFYSIFFPSFLGIQLTLQYIAMFIVGMAASTFIYTKNKIKRLFYIFISIQIIISGIAYIFSISELLSAAFVMTLVFAGILLLSIYFVARNKMALGLYLIFLILIYFAITRMAIFLMLLIAPFHMAKYNFYKRIFTLTIMVFIGLIIFYSSSFQQKTFFSGKGEITDVALGNENFQSSGRVYLHELLYEEIDKNPMFGQGPRADLEKFKKNDLTIKEAHNDFISVRYNYGWVGLSLLLFGFFVQIIRLIKFKKFLVSKIELIMYYSSLTAFLAWAGFMYSDNILKYSTYFGNYHFCLIAILYSVHKHEIVSKTKKRIKHIHENDFSYHSIVQ